MKRLFFFLAALCCLSPAPANARACSCRIGDPAFEHSRARAVFVGRVLGGTERVTLEGGGDDGYVHVAGRVSFAVEEVFKGEAAGEIVLDVASMKGTSCGTYSLRSGVSYVVYAYAGMEGKGLRTGVCTRTVEAGSQYAKEDLDFLRNLPPPGSGGGIEGKVSANLRNETETPLAGIKVEVTGADRQKLTALTGADGRYEFARLKPGTYRVAPKLPPNYILEKESVEVEVEDRARAHAAFEAYAAGAVSGRLTDTAGRGFNAALFGLAGDGRRLTGASSGRDGGFKVEGVPPGEYLLYVELDGDRRVRNKSYYYPGTFRREEATPVRVPPGGKIEGLQLTLPAGFLVRTLEGRVVWKDGRPAAGVQVSLACPRGATSDAPSFEHGPARAVTDARGSFSFEALAGETYSIEASGNTAPDGRGQTRAFHSPPRRISPAAAGPQPLRLVLSEPGFPPPGCDR